MLGRTYLMTYTDGRAQAQTERGRLVTLDQEGFAVLGVDGKHLLVPKTRIVGRGRMTGIPKRRRRSIHDDDRKSPSYRVQEPKAHEPVREGGASIADQTIKIHTANG